jgi:hypothetical protein
MAILTGIGPEAKDPSIGCEKCHGPGGHHLLAVEASSQPKDLAIARPSIARGEPVIALCGQCHDPRKIETKLAPTLETASRFQASSLTLSRCYSESGQKLDCVTCHNPHRDAETRPEFYEAKCLECHSSRSTAADSSQQSFGGAKSTFTARTTCPVQPSSGCISCHMPKGKTPIPHSLFTDHFIRIHHDATRASATDSAAR